MRSHALSMPIERAYSHRAHLGSGAIMNCMELGGRDIRVLASQVHALFRTLSHPGKAASETNLAPGPRPTSSLLAFRFRLTGNET